MDHIFGVVFYGKRDIEMSRNELIEALRRCHAELVRARQWHESVEKVVDTSRVRDVQRGGFVSVAHPFTDDVVHDCLGCSYRWQGAATNGPLCGDCWRLAQPVLPRWLRHYATTPDTSACGVGGMATERLDETTCLDCLRNLARQNPGA